MYGGLEIIMSYLWLLSNLLNQSDLIKSIFLLTLFLNEFFLAHLIASTDISVAVIFKLGIFLIKEILIAPEPVPSSRISILSLRYFKVISTIFSVSSLGSNIFSFISIFEL